MQILITAWHQLHAQPGSVNLRYVLALQPTTSGQKPSLEGRDEGFGLTYPFR
jgi:hypothetical protein